MQGIQKILCNNLGVEVIIVSEKISTLIPVGENFSSTIDRYEVVFKRSETSQKETFDLVRKMPVKADFNDILNNSVSFSKEILMYKRIVPEFMCLEEEAGCANKYKGSFTPKLYEGHITKNDTLILMQNLKPEGYTLQNKMIGLDFKHSETALLELARFHALGIALRHAKPDVFLEFKEVLDLCHLNTFSEDVLGVPQMFLDIICADPRIAKYKEQLTNIILEHNWMGLLVENCVEPWISIIHNDFWVNNMMFKESDGQIDEIKFIDFQLSSVGNVSIDLHYFFASIQQDILVEHLDDLIDVYYNRLIEVLQDVGCDSSVFTRQSLDEDLKIEAKRQLFHCLIAVKFFTKEHEKNEDPSNIKNSVMTSKGNKIFYDRTWTFICTYLQRDWL